MDKEHDEGVSTIEPKELTFQDRDGPHHLQPTPTPIPVTTPLVVSGTFKAELPSGDVSHIAKVTTAPSYGAPDPGAFFAPILDAAVTGFNSYKKFKENKVNTLKQFIATPAGKWCQE